MQWDAGLPVDLAGVVGGECGRDRVGVLVLVVAVVDEQPGHGAERAGTTMARGELERLGEEARLAEQAARGARQRRNAALSRILSWGAEGDTDSALGRRGGVSHTTVAKLRAAGDDDRQDEAEAS